MLHTFPFREKDQEENEYMTAARYIFHQTQLPGYAQCKGISRIENTN